MPERPIKKEVTFSASDTFQKVRTIFTRTHMYTYFRETNQVTKPSELREAAPSEENVHKVVLFVCASPPCSADIYLERLFLIKKEIIFIRCISYTQTVFLYCNYPLHSDIDFATEKSYDFESYNPVSGICRIAGF